MEASIEPRRGYIYVHASGEYKSAEQAVTPARMAEACLLHRCNRLLIDARNLTGEISTVDRFFEGEGIAEAFKDTDILIALVGRLPKPFFEMVVTNRGVNMKAFTSLDSAVAWLRA